MENKNHQTKLGLHVSQRQLDSTKFQLLTLYPGTATHWSTLYAALKIVLGVRILVQPNLSYYFLGFTMVRKVYTASKKQGISEKIIFCIGELRTVFPMLKVIGKFIEELIEYLLKPDIWVMNSGTNIRRKTSEEKFRSSHGFISSFIKALPFTSY